MTLLVVRHAETEAVIIKASKINSSQMRDSLADHRGISGVTTANVAVAGFARLPAFEVAVAELS